MFKAYSYSETSEKFPSNHGAQWRIQNTFDELYSKGDNFVREIASGFIDEKRGGRQSQGRDREGEATDDEGVGVELQSSGDVQESLSATGGDAVYAGAWRTVK